MAIIAITTNNSIRVKALFGFFIIISLQLSILQLSKYEMQGHDVRLLWSDLCNIALNLIFLIT